jgi:hypothetical protein
MSLSNGFPAFRLPCRTIIICHFMLHYLWSWCRLPVIQSTIASSPGYWESMSSLPRCLELLNWKEYCMNEDMWYCSCTKSRLQLKAQQEKVVWPIAFTRNLQLAQLNSTQYLGNMNLSTGFFFVACSVHEVHEENALWAGHVHSFALLSGCIFQFENRWSG